LQLEFGNINERIELLLQFENYLADNDIGDIKQRLIQSICMRANDAIRVPEANALPLKIAMKLREYVTDNALKWNFTQSWLISQSKSEQSMDEQQIRDLLQEETIPASDVMWLFKFVV